MTAEIARVIQINPEADLDNKSLSLYEQATSLVIVDRATYGAAGEVGKALKSLVAEITDFHEPMRISAKAAYDSVLKSKNDALAPVNEAMEIVRKTMNTYAQEQERIRKEDERKAQVKANEEAQKEREKLEAQAEKAIEKGQDEKADSLLEKAENVYAAPVYIAPVIDKTVKTASGNITQAKELKITITNMVLFLENLCLKNPGAVASIVKIGDGPLKSFVKTNGLKSFPGLNIVETVGVRL